MSPAGEVLGPVAATQDSNARLGRAEWCALLVGVAIAHAFLWHEWFYPSSYDAGLYANIGREIAEHGLFHRFSAADLRTYGYPLFLSIIHRGADALRLPFATVLFEVQLLLYVAACLSFGNALFRFSPPAARVTFCTTLCNFYVLIYLPESLTESLSTTLLILAGACWLESYRRRANLLPLLAGSLAVGLALMVRPGNLFMLAAWTAGLIVIGVRQRPSILRALVSATCVAAVVALPMIPQLVNNAAFFGRITPFVVLDLGKMQQVWGIQNIKYATAMPPVPTAAIYYNNPLWLGTTINDERPWRWYFDYPGRGILTLAIHAFNLTDQDLLFTYSRDLDPWYRVPLGIVNHAVVALGLAGLFLIMRRARAERDRFAIDATVVLLLLMCSNLAVYVWTAVEMRFGTVLLLLLAPPAAHAVLRLASRRDPFQMFVWGVAVGAYVVLALQMSGWVRGQAEAIRQTHTLLPLSAPVRSPPPQRLRRQLTEHVFVVGDEVAKMPEAPARSRILHGLPVASRLQVAAYTVQAQRTQEAHRVDAKNFLEAVLQRAPAASERLAQARDRDRLVDVRLHVRAGALDDVLPSAECLQCGIVVAGSDCDDGTEHRFLEQPLRGFKPQRRGIGVERIEDRKYRRSKAVETSALGDHDAARAE